MDERAGTDSAQGENTGEIVGRINRRRALQLLGLSGAGVALAACGGGSAKTATSSAPSGTRASPASNTSFPLGAAAKAKGVTTITMWHSMTSNNLKTLEDLVGQFNASQHKIRVNLLGQASYTDTFTKYRSSAGTSAAPQLVQMESILLQDMVDSQSVVPVASAMRQDSSFDSSDVAASALDYFTVDGVQWAMPWNCSAQVMYYNKNVFSKAGLDPSTPPRTFAEYRQMAEQAKSKAGVPYGTALKLAASNFEDWTAQTGGLLLDHGNGRSGRATAVAFGGPIGDQLFSFLGDMWSSKVAEVVDPTSYDNLIAIGNGSTAMAIDTSAALGTVILLLQGGKYQSVDLGVGPLPGLHGPGAGVPYGGAGLYIVKNGTPAQQDASWQFIKFLLTPGAMATWAIGSGYIPITKSSVQDPALKAAWAKTPQYKVAYDQLQATKATAATAGAVTGALSQIETDIENAMTLVSNGTSPAKALAQAVSSSNAAIQSYNSSV